MKWEQVYNSLSKHERQIIDLANENRIDLTYLANIQVQKQENDTNLNEVRNGLR